MPDYISRGSGAGGLFQEDYVKGIIKNATLKSAVMSLFTRRTMTRKQQRASMLNTKPSVGFVTGSDTDVGLKAVTTVDWVNLFLNAEPMAGFVVIPEDVLDDVEYDLWGEIKPELEEAVAVAIDRAVFFGKDGLGAATPSTWPTDIKTQCVNTSNVVSAGTGVDLAADLNSAMGAVEKDGYRPTGWFMRIDEEANLRGLRTTTREFLFNPDGPSDTGAVDQAYVGRIYGKPSYSSMEGIAEFADGAGNARFFTGDWSKFAFGVRTDMRYKIITEGVILNADGSIKFNLPQQDMIALRFVIRCGWQVRNPVTRQNTDSTTRFPAALVRTAP